MRAADPAGFDTKVAQGRASREATGSAETVPVADSDAAMQTADTVDYYTRRAAHPNYAKRFAVMSREHFLPFDVQRASPRLTVPVVMIHSENALSSHWARSFHEALPGEKAILWVASEGQTDFYDDPALVEAAADRLAEHFQAHLT